MFNLMKQVSRYQNYRKLCQGCSGDTVAKDDRYVSNRARINTLKLYIKLNHFKISLQPRKVGEFQGLLSPKDIRR